MISQSLILSVAVVLVSFGIHPVKAEASHAEGFVFLDSNGNGMMDRGEPGIAGIPVSNQVDIVKTDANGKWSLPTTDDTIFFVIKPAGYDTPVNEHNLPQFYYVHKPAGSPDFKYPGVNPTGRNRLISLSPKSPNPVNLMPSFLVTLNRGQLPKSSISVMMWLRN